MRLWIGLRLGLGLALSIMVRVTVRVRVGVSVSVRVMVWVGVGVIVRVKHRVSYYILKYFKSHFPGLYKLKKTIKNRPFFTKCTG